jgi:hypothetical protein
MCSAERMVGGPVSGLPRSSPESNVNRTTWLSRGLSPCSEGFFFAAWFQYEWRNAHNGEPVARSDYRMAMGADWAKVQKMLGLGWGRTARPQFSVAHADGLDWQAQQPTPTDGG